MAVRYELFLLTVVIEFSGATPRVKNSSAGESTNHRRVLERESSTWEFPVADPGLGQGGGGQDFFSEILPT